jgi:hypothetical protein
LRSISTPSSTPTLTETSTIIPEAATLPITVIQKKKTEVEPILHKFIDIKPIIISEEENVKLEKYTKSPVVKTGQQPDPLRLVKVSNHTI